MAMVVLTRDNYSAPQPLGPTPGPDPLFHLEFTSNTLVSGIKNGMGFGFQSFQGDNPKFIIQPHVNGNFDTVDNYFIGSLPAISIATDGTSDVTFGGRLGSRNNWQSFFGGSSRGNSPGDCI
jgi:hypothetical protein